MLWASQQRKDHTELLPDYVKRQWPTVCYSSDNSSASLHSQTNSIFLHGHRSQDSSSSQDEDLISNKKSYVQHCGSSDTQPENASAPSIEPEFTFLEISRPNLLPFKEGEASIPNESKKAKVNTRQPI